MKKQLAIILGLGLVSAVAVNSASACMPQLGEKRVVISCRDAAEVMDAGYFVEVEEKYVGKPEREKTLIVSEQTIMGPRPIGSAPVREVRPSAIGGGFEYLGQHIRLDVNFTTTPTSGGEHFGVVRGAIGNREVNAELLCRAITYPQLRCL